MKMIILWKLETHQKFLMNAQCSLEILSLPTEMLVEIRSYLDVTSRARFRLVNKHIREVDLNFRIPENVEKFVDKWEILIVLESTYNDWMGFLYDWATTQYQNFPLPDEVQFSHAYADYLTFTWKGKRICDTIVIPHYYDKGYVVGKKDTALTYPFGIYYDPVTAFNALK